MTTGAFGEDVLPGGRISSGKARRRAEEHCDDRKNGRSSGRQCCNSHGLTLDWALRAFTMNLVSEPGAVASKLPELARPCGNSDAASSNARGEAAAILKFI